MPKVTKEQIKAIISMKSAGETSVSIAKQLGIHEATVSYHTPKSLRQRRSKRGPNKPKIAAVPKKSNDRRALFDLILDSDVPATDKITLLKALNK